MATPPIRPMSIMGNSAAMILSRVLAAFLVQDTVTAPTKEYDRNDPRSAANPRYFEGIS